VIRRSVKIQLMAFFLIAVLVVLYAGTKYLGFGQLVNPPMKVTVFLDQTGGIFTSASVTERGVTVGKVGDMNLTSDGVSVQLLLNHGVKIPADAKAVVANLSFVGEQYVDLEPQSDSAPYLKSGSVIQAKDTTTPVPDAQLLSSLDQLVNSVNKNDLRTVVDELDNAFSGTGPSLQTIIDKGDDLTASLKANLPQTLDLIKNSQQVLGTVQDTGGELKTFSQQLALLTGQLKSSDPDIRTLLDNGTAASLQLSDVLNKNKTTLPLLLANLATLGDIADVRIPGLKETLIVYPEVVRNSGYAVPGDGTVKFGLVADENVGVCTAGYEGTTKRTGSTIGAVSPNTAAACDEPINSSIDVRGSRNAPRPAGDKTDPALGGTLTEQNVALSGTPGTSGTSGTTSALPTGIPTTDDSESKIQLAGYDPTSRLLQDPAGQDVVLAPTNGSAPLLGTDGWKWILLGSVARQG
jgi:phospholipid/cholesterol/gamma-HCH transport system substrate-binding protein